MMDAKELVSILAQAALFLVMVSFGLQSNARGVLAAMRNTDLLVRGVVAVNCVVPLVALICCLLLPISPEVKIGIVVMAVSPLAPVLPAKMRGATFDTSACVGIYVALILLAVIFVPLTIGLISAFSPVHASVDVISLAKLVLLSVLAPVAIGIAVGTFAPALAKKGAKIATILGFGGLALLVVLVLYKSAGATLALIGDGSVMAIAITVLAGVVAGHLLGRPDPGRSHALALAAGIRHPGIAALIAKENFTDPKVMLAIVLFLLTSVVVATAYNVWSARRIKKHAIPAVAA
jgi:bile acid:Na+ symporter, BASS family